MKQINKGTTQQAVRKLAAVFLALVILSGSFMTTLANESARGAGLHPQSPNTVYVHLPAEIEFPVGSTQLTVDVPFTNSNPPTRPFGVMLTFNSTLIRIGNIEGISGIQDPEGITGGAVGNQRVYVIHWNFTPMNERGVFRIVFDIPNPGQIGDEVTLNIDRLYSTVNELGQVNVQGSTRFVFVADMDLAPPYLDFGIHLMDTTDLDMALPDSQNVSIGVSNPHQKTDWSLHVYFASPTVSNEPYAETIRDLSGHLRIGNQGALGTGGIIYTAQGAQLATRQIHWVNDLMYSDTDIQLSVAAANQFAGQYRAELIWKIIADDQQPSY